MPEIRKRFTKIFHTRSLPAHISQQNEESCCSHAVLGVMISICHPTLPMHVHAQKHQNKGQHFSGVPSRDHQFMPSPCLYVRINTQPPRPAFAALVARRRPPDPTGSSGALFIPTSQAQQKHGPGTEPTLPLSL